MDIIYRIQLDRWNYRRLLCFLVLFPACYLLYTTCCFSAVTVEASADKQNITIGDPVVYTVTLTCPEGTAVALPEKKPELGQWAVRDVQNKEERSQGALKQQLIYTLATFTTGEVLIPEMSFAYKDKEGNENEVKSAAVPVMVESVLAKLGDQGDIRDVKPPLALKTPPGVYLFWLIVIIALAGALSYWYSNYKKRMAAQFPVPEVPKRPPFEVALEELEKLKNSELIKEGRVKEFYIALSDIVRAYLAPVYSIETMDKTTYEIYQQLRQNVADKKAVGLIKDFFDECDLVKFAKYRPEESVCLQDWETARNIIKAQVSG